MLRIARNGTGPKVSAAKWAADHQTQGTNRSTEGRCRASGGTCHAGAAKTVKNQGARMSIHGHSDPATSKIYTKSVDRRKLAETGYRRLNLSKTIG